MQCDICSRPEGAKLPFRCATCSRNALYELRFQHAQVLLHREDVARHLQAAIACPTTETEAQEGDRGHQAWNQERKYAYLHSVMPGGKDELLERTQEIRHHADRIRKSIEFGKADIARRKIDLSQRRSQITAASSGLFERQTSTLDKLARSISRTDQSWNRIHMETVNARVFLCTEAADLCGLRQRRRKRADLVKEEYTIGGLAIVDLRDLNSMLATTDGRFWLTTFQMCRPLKSPSPWAALRTYSY